MLIDTHCHLQSYNYNNSDEIIKESLNSGIAYLIINGYNLKTNEEAILLSKKYNNVYAAIGYGPSIANDVSEEYLKVLEQQLKELKVIAVGEIGLDYYWTKNNTEKQQYIFRRQIELAKKYKKPVIVHNRDSTNDVYTILNEMNINTIGGIMHCYNASLEMAYKFIEIGMLIGVGGVITFKNTKLGDVIKEISLEYIVLESDSPYLTPEPYRGNKNEPRYIEFVARKIASLKQINYDDVVYETSNNVRRLFDLKSKI